MTLRVVMINFAKENITIISWYFAYFFSISAMFLKMSSISLLKQVSIPQKMDREYICPTHLAWSITTCKEQNNLFVNFCVLFSQQCSIWKLGIQIWPKFKIEDLKLHLAFASFWISVEFLLQPEVVSRKSSYWLYFMTHYVLGDQRPNYLSVMMPHI